MTFGIGISFPKKPSKEDIKKLKRDRFGVVDGGKGNPSKHNDKEQSDRSENRSTQRS